MNPIRRGRDQTAERTVGHWTAQKDECRGNGLVGAKEIPGKVRVVQQHGRKRADLNSWEAEMQAALKSDIRKHAKWGRKTWWYKAT